MRSKHLVVAALLAVAAIALLLSSCRTQVIATEIQTDTIRERYDSIIVQERVIEVQVPVPEVRIEQVVPDDTTSVIETDLYRSSAWLTAGLLHHTLETLQDASLTAQAVVADTTRTTIATDTRSGTIRETVTVEVNKLTFVQKILCATGAIVWSLLGGALLLYLAKFLLKRYGVLKN